jgi:hypothetical protein
MNYVRQPVSPHTFEDCGIVDGRLLIHMVAPPSVRKKVQSYCHHSIEERPIVCKERRNYERLSRSEMVNSRDHESPDP